MQQGEEFALDGDMIGRLLADQAVPAIAGGELDRRPAHHRALEVDRAVGRARQGRHGVDEQPDIFALQDDGVDGAHPGQQRRGLGAAFSRRRQRGPGGVGVAEQQRQAAEIGRDRCGSGAHDRSRERIGSRATASTTRNTA